MRRDIGVVAAVFAALLGNLPAAPAKAEGLILSKGGTSRAAMFNSQKRFLDSRLSTQYSASVRLQPNANSADKTALPRYSGKYNGAYLATARAAARKHGVPEDLFLRLVQQESGWNASATSEKGAKGLAQLMPDTARHLRVNIDNPNENLDGGARYLRQMYDRFGSWRLALAAYNAGPLAVEKHGGIPPYAETRTYVRKILGS